MNDEPVTPETDQLDGDPSRVGTLSTDRFPQADRDDWVHSAEALDDAALGRTPDDGEVGESDAEPFVPLTIRIGQRIIRRPAAWAERPWDTARVVRYVVTALTLGVTTVVMMWVVHLNPLRPSQDLVFDHTTPTGGDFGAHVWGPAYLRDNLLGAFRLNGWSMDWYSGMPAYRFYMVLPALAIILVNLILPYGIAMKLVSVTGLITLPAACWAFGRLGKFRYPMPELFAFAGLSFALDESFSIYGGNLKSTMAGEFSFSIALSIAVLALGVLAAGLRTGKYRVWAAVLIAAACVSHGIVMLYVIVAAIVFCLVWIDRTRIVYAVTVGVTAALLTMWWVGPFLLGHEYMTDMKYGALTDWWAMYFPLTAPLDFIITTFAIAGFVMSIVRRHLNGAALGVTCLVFVVGVYLAQDSLPVIGLLWNPRLLPFLYLIRYLLMMVGIVEVASLFINAARDRRALAETGVGESTGIAVVTGLSVLLIVGFMFQSLGWLGAGQNAAGRYSWGPITATETNKDAQGDGWSRYNFRGYEGRDQYYTEYNQVVTTMERIGNDPALGCGRALWENSGDNGNYGTTMALMLLPHWTNGCISSMEGLFFEASGTTPYHFLTTAALSKQSSNPVRELRYTNNDAAVGVRHAQDLGVKYVMVRTPEAKSQAASQPELSLVATAAPWEIYRVAGSDVVVPLAVQPVVVERRLGDGEGADDPRERHLETGVSWFQHPEEWAAMPADDGPPEWQRVDVQPDLSRRVVEGQSGGPNVDIVVPTTPITPVELPPVTISNYELQQESLSFDVDQLGVPVLVRVSYFPNWNADGADGPYRIGPNMMVVIPTDTHVELSYGRTFSDYFTILLTLIGVGLCVLWRRRGDVVHADQLPVPFAALATSLGAEVDERHDDDPVARHGAEELDAETGAGDVDWSDPTSGDAQWAAGGDRSSSGGAVDGSPPVAR